MERDVKFNSNSKADSGRRSSKDKSTAGRHKDADPVKSSMNKLRPGEYDYFGLYGSSAAEKSHAKNERQYIPSDRNARSGQRTSENKPDAHAQKDRGSKSSRGKAETGGAGANPKPASYSAGKQGASAKNADRAYSNFKNMQKSFNNTSSRGGQNQNMRSKNGGAKTNGMAGRYNNSSGMQNSLSSGASSGNARSSAGSKSTARGVPSKAGRKEALARSANSSSGRSSMSGMQTFSKSSDAGAYGQSKASGSNRQNAKRKTSGRAANANVMDKPKQQNDNKRGKRRRHGSPILLYIMLIILVIGISAVLCCTVFFGAESIEISGTSRYSAEQIISASSLSAGDNIFVTNTSDAENKIVTQLPYIKSAEISRTLFPPKFVITIEETQAKYVTEDGSIVMDDDFKILESAASPDMDKTGLTVLKGANMVSPENGKTAVFENENIYDILKQITSELDRQGISDITKIDLSDTMDIRIIYQNRILMLMGSTAELEYKMSYTKTMLTKQLSATQQGKLDLSWLVSGNSTVYFTQGSIEMFEAERNDNTSSGVDEPGSGTSSDTASAVSSGTSGSAPVGSSSSESALSENGASSSSSSE